MSTSVSLTVEDLAELDRYVAENGLASRSEGVSHAVRLLRASNLMAEYACAFQEWEESGEEAPWEQAVADCVNR